MILKEDMAVVLDLNDQDIEDLLEPPFVLFDVGQEIRG
jgi:hypothetical protein